MRMIFDGSTFTSGGIIIFDGRAFTRGGVTLTFAELDPATRDILLDLVNRKIGKILADSTRLLNPKDTDAKVNLIYQHTQNTLEDNVNIVLHRIALQLEFNEGDDRANNQKAFTCIKELSKEIEVTPGKNTKLKAQLDNIIRYQKLVQDTIIRPRLLKTIAEAKQVLQESKLHVPVTDRDYNNLTLDTVKKQYEKIQEAIKNIKQILQQMYWQEGLEHLEEESLRQFYAEAERLQTVMYEIIFEAEFKEVNAEFKDFRGFATTYEIQPADSNDMEFIDRMQILSEKLDLCMFSFRKALDVNGLSDEHYIYQGILNKIHAIDHFLYSCYRPTTVVHDIKRTFAWDQNVGAEFQNGLINWLTANRDEYNNLGIEQFVLYTYEDQDGNALSYFVPKTDFDASIRFTGTSLEITDQTGLVHTITSAQSGTYDMILTDITTLNVATKAARFMA